MKRIVIGGFVFIVFCGVCIFYYLVKQAVTPVRVRVTKVQTGPLSATVPGMGRIIAQKKEQVLSLTGGIIVDMGKSVGQFLQKGTVIASLRLQENELRKKKQELENALIDFELLEEQVSQSEDLLRAKAVSERELKELRIRKHKQEKYIQDLREQISEKSVTISSSGLLIGKYFNGGDHVGTGTQLATVVDTGSIAVEIRVSQHNIPYIHPGQKVQFVSQLFQGIRMGKVLKIAKSSFNSQLNQPEPVGIEPEFAVLASIVTAKSDNLLLGAQIDARFVVKEKSMTICIPAEAFLYKNDSSLVFVANNGSARRRTIQIGLANDCFLEVTSGLTAADTVITFGNLDVFEGCTITTDENKYSNDQAKPKNKLNLPEF